MSKSTISTFELFPMFPDQESARVYFEARRWPDLGPPARRAARRCASAPQGRLLPLQRLSARFHHPNRNHLRAVQGAAAQMALRDVSARHGAQRHQQRPASFADRRHAKDRMVHASTAAQACGNDPTELAGLSKSTKPTSAERRPLHESKRLNLFVVASARLPLSQDASARADASAEVRASVTGRNAVGFTTATFRSARRSTPTKAASTVASAGCSTARNHQSRRWRICARRCDHERHRGVFALLKRGLHGVYHHASPKHLHHTSGFAFRRRRRREEPHAAPAHDRMFAAAIGQRLTYKELIA